MESQQPNIKSNGKTSTLHTLAVLLMRRAEFKF